MKLAMIFPGQGSQTVGMGRELADQFSEARAVFDEVDDALGEKLSDIVFEGSQESLTLTANAQPALMAVSIAALRALESRGFSLEKQVTFVAGHSLGEYSALCAAGALNVTNTARLLRIRGTAMQAAVPVGEGGMAAIMGLERNVVDTICRESAGDRCCQIANDNGGGQLVISGSKSEVENAAAIATEKGARRAIILPVSAPFHSALMQPAADAMHEALADANLNTPVVPLIANVLATPISDPDEIKARLVEQVTGQVRWQESVEYMVANGITHALETGAGKVLTGLGRRISRDIKGVAVGSPDDIEKTLETLTE
ncbi:MAG: ACP S-malonyltransferase [Hyphomicrobiales bacterium]|nr:ACP S-malonyltransferase [Hyphomicrobiales bacterium]